MGSGSGPVPTADLAGRVTVLAGVPCPLTTSGITTCPWSGPSQPHTLSSFKLVSTDGEARKIGQESGEVRGERF